MELNKVHRTSCVRLAEDVKSSTDYRMRFVHEQENKPEKESLIHLPTNFKTQVQMMDTTQDTEINTAPMIASEKKKGKLQKKYQQIYSDKWEND